MGKKKEKEGFSPLSYCGFDCSLCPIYRVTVNPHPETEDEICKRYGYNHSELICMGCHSVLVFKYCRECEIAQCAKKNNVNVCFHCKDFPCKLMKKIDDFHKK